MSVLRIEIRELIKQRSKGVCERCGKRRAEHMHHLTYDRKGHELPEDIQHICLQCHGEYHPQHKFKALGEQRVIAAHHRRKASGKQSKNPWKSLEQQARRELAKAARFNAMPVSRRKSY